MQSMNPELCFENDDINHILFYARSYSKTFTDICKILLALSVQFSLVKLPTMKNFHQLCICPRLQNELMFTDLKAFSSADSC